ncbi:MAG: hypothetical protein AAF865_12495 [Pseudomonadota bacterium]
MPIGASEKCFLTARRAEGGGRNASKLARQQQRIVSHADATRQNFVNPAF